MNERIYLWDLFDKEQTPKAQRKMVGKNPYYDLSPIPSPKVREEMAAFIRWRSTQVCAARVYSDRQYYKKLCRFFQESIRPKTSLLDKPADVWIRQFKSWMFKEQIPLYEAQNTVNGSVLMIKVREISYLEHLLNFLTVDDRKEEEKDVWELDKLGIDFRNNPIKRVRRLVFTGILQDAIRQEANLV